MHARVDRVLDRLLECVLLPLLRANTPLCFARLAPLLPVPPLKDEPSRSVGEAKDKSKDKDKGAGSSACFHVRSDRFALIAASLEALGAFLSTPSVRHSGPAAAGAGSGNLASGIRNRLGLEAIGELEALYVVSCPPAAAPTPPLPPALLLSQPQPTTSSEPHLPTPPPTLVSQSSQPQTRTQPESLSTRGRMASSGEADGPLRPSLGSGRDDGQKSCSGDSGVAAVTTTTNTVPIAIDPVFQHMSMAICEHALSRLAPL